MKIKGRYLVFLWKDNGPADSTRSLQEVIETECGFYFRHNQAGYFQIPKTVFDKTFKDTKKDMPELNVQYSQPRKK